MKTRHLAPAAVLVALLTASCSTQSPAPAEPPEPAGTRTQTEEPSVEPTAEEPVDEETEEPVSDTPETNARGNLVKEIGETAGLTDEATGEWTLDFKVTDIETGFKCTSDFYEAPANGQYVALWFEVNTTEAWDSEMMGDFNMNPHEFEVFDENNMRLNDAVGNAYLCLSDADQLPSAMGPAQSANGAIVLDVPKGAGVVAYRPVYLMGGGWEWAYGG